MIANDGTPKGGENVAMATLVLSLLLACIGGAAITSGAVAGGCVAFIASIIFGIGTLAEAEQEVARRYERGKHNPSIH